MKIFKNALCTKVVMAVLAVAGLLVSSCQQEDVDTVFEPGSAFVTVTASVYDAVNGQDVTSQATITGTGKLEYPNGVTAGTTVTVSASYNGMTGSQTITLNSLAQGGVASYHVNIVLDGVRPTPDPTDNGYVLKLISETPVTEDFYSVPNSASHSHVYNGTTWFENDTEYFYPWSVSFDFPDKLDCTDYYFEGMTKSDEDAYMALIYTMQENHANHAGTVNWKASAWSLSRAHIQATTITQVYNIVGDVTGKVYGSFTMVDKYHAVQAEAEEIAHPNHASHYVYGHAHNQDGTQNAGGGIVTAD